MINKIYVVDDFIMRKLFMHDKDCKIVFAFFQKCGITPLIASNIYKKLTSSPKIKESERTISRLKFILNPYGNDSYDDVSFEEATINLVNLHSNIGQVHYITGIQQTYGTDEDKEIVQRSTLTVSNPAKVVDMIRYFDSGFMDWYDGLELLRIQKMDSQAKESTISSLESEDKIKE